MSTTENDPMNSDVPEVVKQATNDFIERYGEALDALSGVIRPRISAGVVTGCTCGWKARPGDSWVLHANARHGIVENA